jgi:hypothetical protein
MRRLETLATADRNCSRSRRRALNERTRNPEIPRCAIADLRSGSPEDPGTTVVELVRGPACCAEPLILGYQPACKPGFVGHRLLAQTIRDGHSSGTTFARCLEQPTRTASLTSPCGVIAFQRTFPRCRPYSVLLPVWFAMPVPLPDPRCALTAPFHPYSPSQLTLLWRAVRSLWHCPWGRPRRTLSGTVCRWSPDFPLPQPFDRSRSGRPAD